MHCVLEDPSTRLVAALQFFQEMISANVKKSQIHVSPLAVLCKKIVLHLNTDDVTD